MILSLLCVVNDWASAHSIAELDEQQVEEMRGNLSAVWVDVDCCQAMWASVVEPDELQNTTLGNVALACAFAAFARPWVPVAFESYEEWITYWDDYWNTTIDNQSIADVPDQEVLVAKAVSDRADLMIARSKRATESNIVTASTSTPSGGANETAAENTSAAATDSGDVSVSFTFTIEQAVISMLAVGLAVCVGVIIFLCVTASNTRGVLEMWDSGVTSNIGAFNTAAATTAAAIDSVFAVVRNQGVQEVVARVLRRLDRGSRAAARYAQPRNEQAAANAYAADGFTPEELISGACAASGAAQRAYVAGAGSVFCGDEV